MSAQAPRTVKREAGILMLNCPYCDDLESLRSDCIYCGGFGKVPGPRLYAIDYRPEMPGMYRNWREFWRKSFWVYGFAVSVAALFGCFVLPWLFRLIGW